MTTPTLTPLQEALFFLRVLYDLSFFFLVIIIIIQNLIFGVIIDTFADLRSEKNKKDYMLKNTCFICGEYQRWREEGWRGGGRRGKRGGVEGGGIKEEGWKRRGRRGKGKEHHRLLMFCVLVSGCGLFSAVTYFSSLPPFLNTPYLSYSSFSSSSSLSPPLTFFLLLLLLSLCPSPILTSIPLPLPPPISLSPGLPRQDFENKEVTFEFHIFHEHNLWHYLDFIVHLHTKDKTEFTGPESYVYKMMTVSHSMLVCHCDVTMILSFFYCDVTMILSFFTVMSL